MNELQQAIKHLEKVIREQEKRIEHLKERGTAFLQYELGKLDGLRRAKVLLEVQLDTLTGEAAAKKLQEN